MHLAISIQEDNGLDSQVSTIFGRCPYFIFIDPTTKEFSIEANVAKNASGGAGIQAAQMVINKGAGGIISGNLGPKAFLTIQAANIPVYQSKGGNVSQALDDYLKNELPVLSEPNVGVHSG